MRWLLTCLFAVFMVLQYQLWFADGGVLATHKLRTEMSRVSQDVSAMIRKNTRLREKIRDVHTNSATVEEYARRDLGMVKREEVFYRFRNDD